MSEYMNGQMAKPVVPKQVEDLLHVYGGQVGIAMNFAIIEAYNRGLRDGLRWRASREGD